MPALLVRLVVAVLVLVAVAAAACHLLPERFAVNAPLGHLLFGRGGDTDPEVLATRLRVPSGLALDVWVSGLAGARGLRPTPAGDVLVSTPRSGRVLLVERDADGDGAPDAVRTLLEGLDRPHGLDLHDGWLYVGETGAVARVRFDPATRRTEGPVERVVTDLPAGGNHWTRTVRIGPDGWLYVSVGSSCNACVEVDPRRAALLRYRPDGSGEEIVASGLRNSVGFDWHPETGALYATDNGRDLLGDDTPPCELNQIVPGGFYGWPWFHGANVPDPDLGDTPEARARRDRAIAPVHEFRAHNAPLGIAFLRGAHWPEAWRGAAIVALHGSWNRTRKDGYEVVSLHWRRDGGIEERPFAVGFRDGEKVFGRPVDVAEGADGALYVSDDYAGAIYRIRPARGDEAAGRGPGRVAGRGAVAPGDPFAGVPPGERAAAAARGAALFASLACARCHDPARVEPGVVPVPLARLGARYDVESLAAWLLAPNPPMPAVDLPAADRRALAVHLLTAYAGETR